MTHSVFQWADLNPKLEVHTEAALYSDTYTNGAVFDAAYSGYRYLLWRGEARTGRYVNFVMLNPSTADADRDDPTILKCLRYVQRWGYSGLVVTNLFAYRATSPKAMKRYPFPVGEHNDEAIYQAAKCAALVVCAWGTDGGHLGRDVAVYNALLGARVEPKCLQLTSGRKPGHPLYLRDDLDPKPIT